MSNSSDSSSSDSSSSSGELAEMYHQIQNNFEVWKAHQEAKKKKKEKATEPRRRKRYPTRLMIERNRATGAAQLFNDYFAEKPTYPDNLFRRRFRMSKELFLRIVSVLESREDYFQQRNDALGKPGFTPIQKCTAALRQLTNGGAADQYDEYLRMAQSTALETMKRFCKSIIQIFGGHYLRRPTAADCEKLLEMHETRHGFPGMLGSIDCMHWAWKNCPVAWRGQFTRGDKGHPTIILEAVASHDLWIWHAFFGVAGSNNDINVLNQSPVFSDVVNGIAPPIQFTANNNVYYMPYFLADGIYPKWPVFVASPSHATEPKTELFKARQESARKDVERALGVLQMRWALIKGPSRLWYRDHMEDIMYACIILHNMIIENEGPNATNWTPDEDEASTSATGPVHQGAPDSFQMYMERNATLRDRTQHDRLYCDLIEEMWAKSSNN